MEKYRSREYGMQPEVQSQIKIPCYKEKILKATRENKVVTNKGAPIRLLSDFATETFQARKDSHEIFKVIKNKDLQPRLLYPGRLSFKNQRRNK